MLVLVKLNSVQAGLAVATRWLDHRQSWSLSKPGLPFATPSLIKLINKLCINIDLVYGPRQRWHFPLQTVVGCIKEATPIIAADKICHHLSA